MFRFFLKFILFQSNLIKADTENEQNNVNAKIATGSSEAHGLFH